MGIILSNTFDGNDTSSAEGRMTGTQNSVLSCFFSFHVGWIWHKWFTFKLLIADFFFAYMVYQQHPTVQNLRSVADNLWMGWSCTERDVIWDHAMQQVVVALLAGLKFLLYSSCHGVGDMYRLQRWCKFVTCRLHFLAREFCSSVPKKMWGSKQTCLSCVKMKARNAKSEDR